MSRLENEAGDAGVLDDVTPAGIGDVVGRAQHGRRWISIPITIAVRPVPDAFPLPGATFRWYDDDDDDDGGGGDGGGGYKYEEKPTRKGVCNTEETNFRPIDTSDNDDDDEDDDDDDEDEDDENLAAADAARRNVSATNQRGRGYANVKLKCKTIVTAVCFCSEVVMQISNSLRVRRMESSNSNSSNRNSNSKTNVCLFDRAAFLAMAEGFQQHPSGQFPTQTESLVYGPVTGKQRGCIRAFCLPSEVHSI
ncbi:hypothetical protein M0804_013062 [Polistes exclamans]|nr:hypothetical protein M0804_013062 [Polistes exclamans]